MLRDLLLDSFWQFSIRQLVQENIDNCDCSQLICPLILLNNAMDSALDRSHVYFGNSLHYHDYSDQRSICAKLFFETCTLELFYYIKLINATHHVIPKRQSLSISPRTRVYVLSQIGDAYAIHLTCSILASPPKPAMQIKFC